MALNQNISMRVKQKHASQADWDKAVNFIPLAGEIIIYDGVSDSNPRIKVGDGVTKVTTLPFVDSVVAAGGLNIYGPDDDMSLTWGETFEVPYLRVSGDRIVEVGMREITLPEEPDYEPVASTTQVTYVTAAGTLPTLSFSKQQSSLVIDWDPGMLPTYEEKTVLARAYSLQNGDAMKLSNGDIFNAKPIPTVNPYLTFSSSNPFTLKNYDEWQPWDGTVYYSTDTINWNTWNGSQINSATSGNMDYLYLRGSGNTIISGGDDGIFVFNAVDLYCDGNIENLLDWETVANGNHPSMDYRCFDSLFADVDCLITAPALPATTLANSCYAFMFYNCTSLTTAPALPATTLALSCYSNMFSGCTSLTTAPALPATSVADQCYAGMFRGCTSLTTIPSLPATTLYDYCYAAMFNGCTQIKLSTTQIGEYQTEYRIPTSGTGSMGRSAIEYMFTNTGGTFAGTPTINTTYYMSNTVIPAN